MNRNECMEYYPCRVGILFKCILCLFTFLSMFFPDAFREFRLCLLLILLLISISRNTLIKGPGLPVITFFLLINIVCMIWGVFNDAPGALRVQTVDLLWPLLFLIIGQNFKRDIHNTIICSIVISYLFICLFDVIYIISNLFGLEIPVITYMINMCMTPYLDANIARLGDIVQYTTNHMCTIIFMVPFMVCLLMDNSIRDKKIIILILLLSLICVVGSGRVALIITSVFCSLLGTLFMNSNFSIGGKYLILFKKMLIVIIGGAILLLGICEALDVNVNGIYKYVENKFETSNDPFHVDNGVRIVQKEALLEGWRESPVIGNGAGSYTDKIIRDDVHPWSYEYSYYALLYQKGLLGALATFSLYIWILYSLIKCWKNKWLRSGVAIPFFSGLLAILIANYADPYLGKFGCMWMIYYPFSIVNLNMDGELR